MLEDVNDEIPLFTEREQETVLEGEPIGTKVTQVNAIDKDGTFPNNLTIKSFQSDKYQVVMLEQFNCRKPFLKAIKLVITNFKFFVKNIKFFV